MQFDFYFVARTLEPVLVIQNKFRRREIRSPTFGFHHKNKYFRPWYNWVPFKVSQ